MRITQVNNNQHNQNFGFNFKLRPETIKAVEESTGLTYKEMTRLSLDESARLMKERGTLKEPNKIFLWLQDKYKKFGEKTGLLKKEYNFYTEI